jgi:transcriptional regulator with XRE-family HTH domain
MRRRARFLSALPNGSEGSSDRRGVSITDLARKSRIDQSRVEAILQGEVDLQLHTVYQLAGALKVRPVRLLEGIEWIPDGPSGGHFRIGDPADR